MSIEIKEGNVRKGGVNRHKPTTKPPPPPKGQNNHKNLSKERGERLIDLKFNNEFVDPIKNKRQLEAIRALLEVCIIRGNSECWEYDKTRSVMENLVSALSYLQKLIQHK